MICPICKFDDTLPIAEVYGRKVMPSERGEFVHATPWKNGGCTFTINGILHAYHLAHFLGIVNIIWQGGNIPNHEPIGISKYVADKN